MPCSQMMSMNISPPRASAASRLAVMPAVKGRILKSGSLNIGCGTRVSTMPNRISRVIPVVSSLSTAGLVHPIVDLPRGSMP